MLHGAYLIMHVYICVFWECMSFSYSMWSEHTANMLTMRSRQRSTCRAICLSSCTRVELDASLRKISRTETWFSLLKLYLVTWYEWNKKNISTCWRHWRVVKMPNYHIWHGFTTTNICQQQRRIYTTHTF